MKEVTEIVTVQITRIGKATDDEAEMLVTEGEALKKQLAEALKSSMDADDVVVTGRKVFARDIEKEEKSDAD